MNNLHPDVNAAHIEDAKNLNEAWTALKQAGRFSPTPPPPMPRQPGEPPLALPGQPAPMHAISMEEIAEIGDKIAKLPHEERPQATLAAHTALATELLNQGKLTIDGKVEIVRNQKQAETLAQRLINEEIGRQDAQSKKASASDGTKGSIIFARHGETKLDQAGANETVAGWTQEPLDDRGRAAAQKLANEIKEQKPTVIVTSDLPRSKQTAEIVGKQLGIPVQEDSRLRPQHVPETEGLKVGEATPIWNSYEENPDQQPKGGETWNQARQRQDAALKDVEALVAKGEKPVVVTHSRNLEMELGEKPKPGGFITRSGGEKGGAVEPGKPSKVSETAPIYEQHYVGPDVDAALLKSLKDNPRVSPDVRSAAQAVFEAIADSGMSVPNAMDLNGNDALAKALGGRFQKTINAKDGSQEVVKLEGKKTERREVWRAKPEAAKPEDAKTEEATLPATRESWRVAKKETKASPAPETAPIYDQKRESLLSGESGEAKPGELARTVAEAAGTIGNYVRDVKHSTDIARDLQRGLVTLDTAKQADILRGVEVMRNMKSAGMTKADDAAVYHHLEDPEGVELKGNQDKWLDDVILPIQDQNDELYKELSDGGNPIGNYVHRVAKGKAGMLDRIATGAKGVGTKGALSKSAPQTKTRTMMAIESPDGERRVVSIKEGKATMWVAGEPTDLGVVKNAKGRSPVENETFPEGEPNSVFYEKGKIVEGPDGYDWKVTQATTKEIEANTELEYYHSALASSVASNIQLSSAVRALRFLEAYKASPEFKEVAWSGSGMPPKGWKTTTLPQLRNYYFEPRTAEVLTDYADRLDKGQFGVLETMQKFLRAAYLINPIVHPLNVAASWSFEKGLTGFAPWKWKRIYKTGGKAIKAVLAQNQDFLDALDAGAALQSHREDLKDIHKLFFDRLAEGLDKKESWAMKIPEFLGIEHGNLLNVLHKPSSTIAWTSSDIMYLQAAYQYQSDHPGVSLSDAFKEVGKIIPEYRLPSRIADSRWAAKAMGNPLVSWFGSYHYGLLKSFAESAKSALGAQAPSAGRTKAEEVGKGWDRLAMLGLITMVLFPYVFDKAAQKLTGDKHARWRRPGPAGYVDAVEQVAEGKQDVSSAIQKVVTPSPITKGAAELVFNREFFSGHQIYDPHADWDTEFQQVGHYLAGDFGQYGQYERVETSAQKKKFFWQQAGVQFGKTRAEKVAGDIAAAKVGTEAEAPEDHKNRVERREILDQLRQGNRQPLKDAEATHGLTHRQILNLEHRAKLDPLEDLVHNFTIAETEKVLDAARKDKDEREIKLLQHILTAKKARARYGWQSPVQPYELVAPQ